MKHNKLTFPPLSATTTVAVGHACMHSKSISIYYNSFIALCASDAYHFTVAYRRAACCLVSLCVVSVLVLVIVKVVVVVVVVDVVRE